MTEHRIRTKPENEPSVGFYRTIAISFLVITIVLLGVVIFFTSKKATITIVAKEDHKSVDVSLDVEISKSKETSISGTVVSKDFYWEETYEPTGSKVIDGTAVGSILIYNKTNFDQPLVKTTRFLTPEGILFRLSERIVVPANGELEANVYADKDGAENEIGPSQFTIPGLSESKQKFIYAESKEPMDGGVRRIGILSEEDLNAARLSYSEKIKKAFLDSISDAVGGDNKVVLSVSGLQAKSDQVLGEEVSAFFLSGTSTISAVFYSETELKSVLENQVKRNIDIDSEKVLSLGDDYSISLVSYDAILGTAQLSVHQDVIVTLDIDAEKLKLENFYNKNKDEIERYVLGLSHVSGVEVKFSPGWIRTAPAVPDRIKVILKNVR